MTIKNNKVRGIGKSYLILFTIFIISFSFVSAELGIYDSSKPKLEAPPRNTITNINESLTNINNSLTADYAERAAVSNYSNTSGTSNYSLNSARLDGKLAVSYCQSDGTNCNFNSSSEVDTLWTGNYSRVAFKDEYNTFTGQNEFNDFTHFKATAIFEDSKYLSFATNPTMRTVSGNHYWNWQDMGFENAIENRTWTITAGENTNPNNYLKIDFNGANNFKTSLELNDLYINYLNLNGNLTGSNNICLTNGTNCPTSSGGNLSWNETRANTLYLKLNQSSPQTTSGTFAFPKLKVGNGTMGTYDMEVFGTSAVPAQFRSNSNSQAYITIAQLNATATTGYSYLGHSVVGAESISTIATPSNGIGFAVTKYGGTSVPLFSAGADITAFSAWADARPKNGELWASGVGINLGKTSPNYSLEVSPQQTLGTNYEYPESTYFNTQFSNIGIGTVYGVYYDNNVNDYYGFYDGGDGYLYSDYDSHTIASIDYNSGFIDSDSFNSEPITEIAYDYTSYDSITAKIKGNIKLDSGTGIVNAGTYGDVPIIEGWNNTGGAYYPSLQFKTGGTGQVIEYKLPTHSSTHASYIGFRQTKPSATDIQRIFQFTDYDNTVEYFYQGIDQSSNPVYVLPNNVKFRFARVNSGTSDILTIDSQNQRVSVGNFITPEAKLHVIATTEQLRLGYNTTTYYTTTVNSTGSVIMDSSGKSPNFVFNDDVAVKNITATIYKNATGSSGLTNTFRIVCDVDLVGLTKKYQNFTYSGGILTGNTTCT